MRFNQFRTDVIIGSFLSPGRRPFFVWKSYTVNVINYERFGDFYEKNQHKSNKQTK